MCTQFLKQFSSHLLFLQIFSTLNKILYNDYTPSIIVRLVVAVSSLSFLFFFRCHLGRGRLDISRHTSRSSTSLVHSARLWPVQDLMSSVHFLGGRPLGRLPLTPPSIISLHMLWCLFCVSEIF